MSRVAEPLRRLSAVTKRAVKDRFAEPIGLDTKGRHRELLIAPPHPESRSQLTGRVAP
jgi:hypothetical protein